VDVAIFICILMMVGAMVIDKSRVPSFFYEYNIPTAQDILQVYNIIHDIKDGTFRMDILMAITAFLLWLKVYLQFKLTRMFGPYIKIIE
jgi:hypothetical protein